MPACTNRPILPARNRKRPSPHLKQTNSHKQGTALQTPSRAPSTQIARDEYPPAAHPALTGTVRGISKGKPFSRLPDMELPSMRKRSPSCFASESAAWRGGDRRPAGAEAPTPPGRSSRAGRGTAGGRCPMPRDREEEGGRPKQVKRPSRMAARTRGWGS